ncbi:hypothetical protein AQUCO_01200185v1 [Aquilegia coerulea]|uniref:Neprosin PEP catalytic domain-containing protein n=1 Tax=Aquilegia coerulea TaxID=218851 RepID=A0A2G5E4W8_AQUCA|nr:hypothetical protein AQUCO_01200185v1 [Aquilegia coerulea]
MQTKYGDIYDCVDIHKQPSLNHPALKNHKIQQASNYVTLNLSVSQKIIKTSETSKCPKGTVPIRRTTAMDNDDIIRSNQFGSLVLGEGFLFAGMYTKKDAFKGVKLATTKMSVWNPRVLNNQSSRAGVSVISGEGFVQAGWTVNPKVYGDNQTRFYNMWTADNFRTGGCFSTHCPGFVVTSSAIALDRVYTKVSEYNGEIQDTFIRIWMDLKGNWWLQGDSTQAIGYWPKELFTSFGPNGASEVQLGGEVYLVPDPVAWTNPPPVMGTGDCIKDWYDQSAYFEQIVFVDSNDETIIPNDTTLDYLQPDQCYVVRYGKSKSLNW